MYDRGPTGIGGSDMTNVSKRDEFERLLLIETNECVLWPFGRNGGGYGRARFDGSDRLTHVVALERRGGPRPPGTEACHTPGIGCQKHCMNYRHLRWDSHRNNLADAVSEGTVKNGERHPCHRLTEDDVREIRRLPGPDLAIAARYGMSQEHISRIRRRQKWKHVE